MDLLSVGVFMEKFQNLADAEDETGEYIVTTIDRDNLVLNAYFGNVVLDYLLQRAEHTVQ